MGKVNITEQTWKSIDFSKAFWLTGVDHAKSNFRYYQQPILVKLKQEVLDRIENAKKNNLNMYTAKLNILQLRLSEYDVLSDWPKTKVNSFKTHTGSYTPQLFETREGAQMHFEHKLQEVYEHLKREADYFLNRIEAIHKQTGVEPKIITEQSNE